MNSASKSVERVIAHRIAADEMIPNHPEWPLLIYPGAVALVGSDPAIAFEELFERNRWPAAWRNGVYPFHHYHSSAHEVLGIYSGEVTVQFGGARGIEVNAGAGDVIVLPAGTGHKKLSSRGALGVVGAYPAGQHPDMCSAAANTLQRNAAAVMRVPVPDCDPVFGAGGPLMRYWVRNAATTSRGLPL